MLQVSRLGKHINELRRKAADRHLANRAKSLVKKWRQLLVNAGDSTQTTLVNGNATNGQTPSKPSSRLTSPVSETPKCNLDLSPALRHSGTSLSSLPSSASTSPGLPLSRPTTPMAGSKPVSPYLKGGPVNNKRTRCDDENGTSVLVGHRNGPTVIHEPDPKRPRLNGSSSNHMTTEDSQHSEDSIIVANHVAMQNNDSTTTSTSTLPSTPKISDVGDAMETRSARRKIRAKEEVQDGLMQRMASIRKSAGKVRTTQELVQEMALRSASPSLINNRTTIVTTPNQLNKETKSELMSRFLESQTDIPSPATSPESTVPAASDGPETVDDVLSRLPPIDPVAVWAEIKALEEEEATFADDDEPEIEGLIPAMPKPAPDTGPEVLQELHDGQKESFNGNFNHEGEFHEWFEVVSKRTKDDDLLFVLPYCVIE